MQENAREAAWPRAGAQFTCFTGTTVQILMLRTRAASWRARRRRASRARRGGESRSGGGGRVRQRRRRRRRPHRYRRHLRSLTHTPRTHWEEEALAQAPWALGAHLCLQGLQGGRVFSACQQRHTHTPHTHTHPHSFRPRSTGSCRAQVRAQFTCFTGTKVHTDWAGAQRSCTAATPRKRSTR